MRIHLWPGLSVGVVFALLGVTGRAYSSFTTNSMHSTALQVVRALTRLKGVGPASAWVLSLELLGWRTFGNRRVRAVMIELAWRWRGGCWCSCGATSTAASSAPRSCCAQRSADAREVAQPRGRRRGGCVARWQG